MIRAKVWAVNKPHRYSHDRHTDCSAIRNARVTVHNLHMTYDKQLISRRRGQASIICILTKDKDQLRNRATTPTSQNKSKAGMMVVVAEVT
jgi:hypothetical protein